MKILTMLLAVLSVGFLLAGSPEIKYVEKYKNEDVQTLLIPSTFAKGGIDMSKARSLLEDKRIYRVDLIYTQFRQSPDFNQVKLNERRTSELLKNVPDIEIDAPEWRWVEQTGAKTVDQAREYFHGFAIYYVDEPKYGELSSFLQEYQHKFYEVEIDNAIGGSLQALSGSEVHVPAGAVTDKAGNPIKGKYTLKYREYRNQAEIAFSGIPMHYREKDESYQFSSVGMYELRAEQNGKDLKLRKPATVDFNCTDVKEGVAFYQMDDESGQWEKIEDLKMGNQNEIVPQQKDEVRDVQARIEIPKNQVLGGLVAMNGGNYDWELDDNQQNIVATFAKSTWEKIQDSLLNSRLSGKYTSYDHENRKFVLPVEHRELFLRTLNADLNWVDEDDLRALKVIDMNGANWNAKDMPRTAGTLLASGADAGHTYPAMVRGLNSPDFGVYNCDQIYRTKGRTTIRPKYVDSQSGKEIKSAHVACLIDMDYNGSFSFDPGFITCNPKGKNALLLFTKDKKVYAVLPQKFESAVSKPNNVFEMKDMTSELKSPNDLKAYLSL